MTPRNDIVIKDACEHNLKHISLRLPRNRFIVVTGLSGSGKSSLAFDTIYAEGQRRYVESLSAYARQFLEQLGKPQVDAIEGLSPTIAIEQKTLSHNPRSTVATQTEIYDYLRLLFARAGVPHCPKCGRRIHTQSVDQIAETVLQNLSGKRILILAPLVQGRKGAYRQLPKRAAAAGFARLRVNGNIVSVDEPLELDRYKIHHIEAVVDRLTLKDQRVRPRLVDSLETALRTADGVVIIHDEEAGYDEWFSERYGCVSCGVNLPEIEPRLFSFNSPYGACPACNGLGTRMEIDPQLLVPDPSKAWLNAIAPHRRGRRNYLMYYRALMRELAEQDGIAPQIPFERLPSAFRKKILYGSNDIIWGRRFEGVLAYLENMFQNTDSDWLKEELNRYMSEAPCHACRGKRLNAIALSVTIDGRSIADLTALSVEQAHRFFNKASWPAPLQPVVDPILKEIKRRLRFCLNVGLGYLTLDRRSATLSGGEAERIRLATQVGSGLVGVIYVMDEPSIGLHQRDNDRLLNTLHDLRDMGNTLIVVEHDKETILRSDYVVDLGPGAGENGGEVVYAGTVKGLLRHRRSLTGAYLSGRLEIPTPAHRRSPKNDQWLVIEGAREHNLKDITVRFPLGCLICVTGVSGSGKSTLVHDVLYRALAQRLYGSREKPGAFRRLIGLQHIDKVIEVDQTPIGRTPRSNPATYTGVFSPIREIFARMPLARMRGYRPGRFSFNVKGGRCEACKGDGIKKIEMHFLPDVYVTCEVCHGKRFTQQTLEITYKDKTIADVLDMSVCEALELFEAHPTVRRILTTLADVGLGYIKLGQPATTLSGGEAQRVKLAAELGKTATGRTLYILDEPTTGLHFADVHKLLEVLHRLVDKGNTVVVIEHNLDIVKTADHIIDLGPEGGDMGGRVVCAGPPEAVMACTASHTGRYLKQHINRPS